jgi:aminopeptidase N
VLDEALAHWSALLYYRDTHSEERASLALDDQLRGVYKVYRTFGGEDMEASRSARDYRNFFQYSAIVASKGALLFAELRHLLGNEKFFAALRSYYKANLFEVARMDDLRGAFIAEMPVPRRRIVTRVFNRWLSSKRGDEDIAPPDPNLASALGIEINPKQARGDGGNAFSRLGKFFWQQMTRLR